MKKFIAFLALFSFFVFSTASYAQEPSEIPNPSPSPKIEYSLPYPGILPNSPVYPLKVARDRLVEFFISDPLKSRVRKLF